MTAINLPKQHPAAYAAVLALSQEADRALEASGLAPTLGELVKIRVSQLNGCAYCLRMHTRDAIALGETTDRLALIAAWWECRYFSAQEQAALALAEDVTRLPIPETRTWDTGALTAEQISAVSWLAIVMNTWNRVAVRSHTPVDP